MCRFFDPAVTEQCTEDDAEEVREKAQANFCDYFKLGYNAFDPAPVAAEDRARNSLDTLFGETDNGTDEQRGPEASSDAEDLFR
jgi:hypothetical protein